MEGFVCSFCPIFAGLYFCNFGGSTNLILHKRSSYLAAHSYYSLVSSRELERESSRRFHRINRERY